MVANWQCPRDVIHIIIIYYIFIAILMLFLVIFKDDKNDNFLRSNVKTHKVAPKAEQMY